MFRSIHTPYYSVRYLMKRHRVPAHSNEQRPDPHCPVILYGVFKRDSELSLLLNSIRDAIEDPVGVS